MENNNNNNLGYYMNKPVYKLKSKYNEGYYVNFDGNNYTLPPWKKDNQNIDLEEAIDAINYKLNTNPSEKELQHLKNCSMKKTINDNYENNVDKIKKYKNRLQKENDEIDEIEEQIKQLKFKKKEN